MRLGAVLALIGLVGCSRTFSDPGAASAPPVIQLLSPRIDAGIAVVHGQVTLEVGQASGGALRGVDFWTPGTPHFVAPPGALRWMVDTAPLFPAGGVMQVYATPIGASGPASPLVFSLIVDNAGPSLTEVEPATGTSLPPGPLQIRACLRDRAPGVPLTVTIAGLPAELLAGAGGDGASCFRSAMLNAIPSATGSAPLQIPLSARDDTGNTSTFTFSYAVDRALWSSADFALPGDLGLTTRQLWAYPGGASLVAIDSWGPKVLRFEASTGAARTFPLPAGPAAGVSGQDLFFAATSAATPGSVTDASAFTEVVAGDGGVLYQGPSQGPAFLFGSSAGACAFTYSSNSPTPGGFATCIRPDGGPLLTVPLPNETHFPDPQANPARVLGSHIGVVDSADLTTGRGCIYLRSYALDGGTNSGPCLSGLGATLSLDAPGAMVAYSGSDFGTALRLDDSGVAVPQNVPASAPVAEHWRPVAITSSSILWIGEDSQNRTAPLVEGDGTRWGVLDSYPEKLQRVGDLSIEPLQIAGIQGPDGAIYLAYEVALRNLVRVVAFDRPQHQAWSWETSGSQPRLALDPSDGGALYLLVQDGDLQFGEDAPGRLVALSRFIPPDAGP